MDFFLPGKIILNQVIFFPIHDNISEKYIKINVKDSISIENIGFSEEDKFWCKSLVIFPSGNILAENCKVSHPSGLTSFYHSLVVNNEYQEDFFGGREAHFSSGIFLQNGSKLFREITYFPLQVLCKETFDDFEENADQLDFLLKPSREEEEVDTIDFDDVKIMKRTPVEEKKIIKELDKELFFYFEKEIFRKFCSPRNENGFVFCIKCIKLTIMRHNKNQRIKCPFCYGSNLCEKCKKFFKKSRYRKCTTCIADEKRIERRLKMIYKKRLPSFFSAIGYFT